MNYQILKQKKDDLIVAFHDSNLQNKDILCIEDYDKLLEFIDEYESLTRQLLQHIKQLETPVTRSKEWENAEVLQTDEEQDDAWLGQFLSLGK